MNIKSSNQHWALLVRNMYPSPWRNRPWMLALSEPSQHSLADPLSSSLGLNAERRRTRQSIGRTVFIATVLWIPAGAPPSFPSSVIIPSSSGTSDACASTEHRPLDRDFTMQRHGQVPLITFDSSRRTRTIYNFPFVSSLMSPRHFHHRFDMIPFYFPSPSSSACMSSFLILLIMIIIALHLDARSMAP